MNKLLKWFAFVWILIFGVESVSVDVSNRVGKVDKRFLSVAIDSHVVALNWKNFDFSDSGVISMASALSPAYIRLGGTAADLMVFREKPKSRKKQNRQWLEAERRSSDNNRSCSCGYDFDSLIFGKGKKKKPRSKFTMSGADWDKLTSFSDRVGWKLLFDGNVLLRRNGKWDPSNMRSLLDYSLKKRKPPNMAFELGNEPNSLHHQLNFTLPGRKLGRDFASMRRLLDRYREYANATLVGPDVNHVDDRCFKKIHPKKRCKALRYLRDVVSTSKGSLDSLTWHQYYLDGHTAGLKEFLSTEPLDKFARVAEAFWRFVRTEMKVYGNPLWLGETGSAFGGGAKGLSDRYVAGFLWLDKLGTAALYGHSVVIRQTFYHGCYAMIGEDLLPNPDFWLSVLHKKLTGRNVLRVSTGSPRKKTLRLFAHCARFPHTGVVLFGSNISPHPEMLPIEKPLNSSGELRQYILSPEVKGEEGLRSRGIRLNGISLGLVSGGEVPELKPRVLSPAPPFLALKPYEMAFWHFPDVAAPACR